MFAYHKRIVGPIAYRCGFIYLALVSHRVYHMRANPECGMTDEDCIGINPYIGPTIRKANMAGTTFFLS